MVLPSTISPGDAIGTAIVTIRQALGLEDGFLDAGRQLGEASEILERVAMRFRGLFADFKGETLADAATNLTGASTQIGALGSTLGGTRMALDQLREAGDTIAYRVERLQQSLRSIQMLTINARIESSMLKGTGEDFSTFSTAIAHLLRTARDSMGGFDHDLRELRHQIQQAYAVQSGFDARRDDAIRVMLDQLQDGARAVAAHHARVAVSAAAIDERSCGIVARLGQAVMALQIGDSTRQRLEHVEQALVDGQHEAAAADPMAQARLTRINCRLAAAQLQAAARELEAAIGNITVAHNGLATDARAITRLGADTFGADGGNSLQGLEDCVSGTLDMLGGYRLALDGVDRLVTAVSDAVSGLGRHIVMIHALESDIRIMGLNTTLKCGRLGKEGAALNAIAQELSGFSRQTSEDATEITRKLATIMSVADTLRAAGAAQTADAITGLGEMMNRSLGGLDTARLSLIDAVEALRGDCGLVVALLEQTIPKIEAQQDVVRAFDHVASSLDAIVPADDGDIDTLSAVESAFLARAARRYTMAGERRVHDLLAAGWGDHTATAPIHQATPAAADLEDILF